MSQLITRRGRNGRLSHQFRCRRGGLEWTKSFPCTGGAKCQGGCAAGTDGAKWARMIERDVDLGQAVPSSGHTVKDLIDYYEKVLLEKSHSPSHRPKMKALLDWWSSRIGHLRLHEVTPRHIAELKAQLATGKASPTGKPLTGSTLNRYHCALSRVWKVAQKRLFWAANNPLMQVARDEENPGKTRWLDADERAALIESAKLSRSRRVYLWTLAGLTMGARESEVAKLTWRDVNLDRREATLTGTKNGSTRVLPLHPLLVEELTIVKRAGVTSLSVFGTFPRSGFEYAVKRAGLEDVTFHTLRHTCATEMGARGASERQLMAFFGWKSSSVVSQYVHNRQELTQDLKDRVSLVL